MHLILRLGLTAHLTWYRRAGGGPDPPPPPPLRPPLIGEPHRNPDHADFVPSVFSTAHKRTGERVFVQQRYERLQERTKKRTKRLSEFQKTLEVAEVVEQNDEETYGNDGDEHEHVGEMNIVHEIDITSAHNDEEQTVPIITEDVIDAACCHICSGIRESTVCEGARNPN